MHQKRKRIEIATKISAMHFTLLPSDLVGTSNGNPLSAAITSILKKGTAYPLEFFHVSGGLALSNEAQALDSCFGLPSLVALDEDCN